MCLQHGREHDAEGIWVSDRATARRGREDRVGQVDVVDYQELASSAVGDEKQATRTMDRPATRHRFPYPPQATQTWKMSRASSLIGPFLPSLK